jgi:hypothetical protein
MSTPPFERGGEFFPIASEEQDCAVISRNELEDQLAKPPLDCFEAADRGYRFARSEQSFQRRCLDKSFRTKIDSIGGPQQHSGSAAGTLVGEFNPVTLGLNLADKEDKPRMPNLNFITVAQNAFINRQIIHVSSVSATEVENFELLAVLLDETVLAGH